MPHRALELLGTAPAVDAEWRGRLGTAYCALSRFLIAQPDLPLSETFYCSHCGGQLLVRPCFDGTFAAIPQDDDSICPTREGLASGDLILKTLSPVALFSSALKGIGVDASVHPLQGMPSAWRLGSVRVGGKRHSLYASLSPCASEYLSAIRSISDERPFIFLGGSYNHECETLLSAMQCGYLCLEDDFYVVDEAGFVPSASAAEKIAQFKKSNGGNTALSDEEAAGLFALAVKLDDKPKLKAPTHLTILKLYCIDVLSSTQIVAQHKFKKTTVLNRMHSLEQKLGRPLKSLRTQSDALAKIAATYSDSRMKKFNARSAVYDDEGFDDD